MPEGSVMSTCKHKIKPTAIEILTLQSAFICELCEEYVEPVQPWRTVRALISTVSLITVLYAAFSRLQGTLEALALMIGIILAAVLVFFIGNYLVLSKAPLAIARPDVNPDFLGEYDDTDDDIEEYASTDEGMASMEAVKPIDPIVPTESLHPMSPTEIMRSTKPVKPVTPEDLRKK